MYKQLYKVLRLDKKNGFPDFKSIIIGGKEAIEEIIISGLQLYKYLALGAQKQDRTGDKHLEGISYLWKG